MKTKHPEPICEKWKRAIEELDIFEDVPYPDAYSDMKVKSGAFISSLDRCDEKLIKIDYCPWCGSKLEE